MLPRPVLQLIAHDIRSRENVGALFRISDSLGVHKLWLTGYTVCPPDPKLAKVALGAENTVVWEQRLDVHALIKELRIQSISVHALELAQGAVDLAEFLAPPQLALLVGNERTGISPSLLSVCDGMIKITQHGRKESLNVSVATGIAAWAILN
mgnify:CR=1 FL=1